MYPYRLNKRRYYGKYPHSPQRIPPHLLGSQHDGDLRTDGLVRLFRCFSALYITGAVEDGGLGFSNEDRGVLQGVTTFFLYLFPVVTGALADRYVYKRMLFAAYCVLGNGWFFLFVFGLPAFLVLGSKYTSDGSFTWTHIWIISGIWGR